MRMNDFDRAQRQHTFFFRIVATFICIVFALVIAVWGFYGYVAYSVISDPSGTAQTIGGTLGEAVKSFNESVK